MLGETNSDAEEPPPKRLGGVSWVVASLQLHRLCVQLVCILAETVMVRLRRQLHHEPPHMGSPRPQVADCVGLVCFRHLASFQIAQGLAYDHWRRVRDGKAISACVTINARSRGIQLWWRFTFAGDHGRLMLGLSQPHRPGSTMATEGRM
jgi:hypothetical protein